LGASSLAPKQPISQSLPRNCLLGISAPDGELAERTFPRDRCVGGVSDLGVDVGAAVLVGERENDALPGEVILRNLGGLGAKRGSGIDD
jgi:hypothetical protein